MIKILLFSFVVLLIWVGWIALLIADIQFSIIIPICLTFLVGVLLIVLMVVKRIRAQRAASQLEKALTEQAAHYAQNARPDLQAEVLEMKVEFEKAVSALKTSKLGRGKDALYALPWQIIIGPPGSGKTTALRNSGLQFPYLSDTRGGAVRGLGGTRNCDWWLTNEAVILDTAGRWTTQEEDRDEWHGFLDLVKRFRPRKPLNGIIVALSVSDIGGATEDAAAILAQKVRERVDEAMNRLQMSLPVYILFTKCDLIPGFVETFGDLSKNDRGQVWGFTVPMTGVTSVAEHFNAHFDQLITQLEARQLKRMGEERRAEIRDMIYIFPRQLDALRANMVAFTAQLFEENVFRETPYFRGVYFTSGTQEGNPIDRVMGRMAAAFGVHTALPLTATPTTPKSYFLRDVFREVVFKDADLAARSAEELRRQRRMRYIVAVAMLGIAALLLTLPAYSWSLNGEMLEDTNALLQVPQSTVIAGVTQPLPPLALAPMFNRVTMLAEGAPLSMGSGMYRGDVIEDSLKDYYSAIFRTRVVGPIIAGLKRELDSFGREYEALRHESPQRAEFDLNRRRLRVYLLVTAPAEPSQPDLRGDLQTELTRDLSAAWASSLSVQLNTPQALAMEQQMSWYVDQMAKNTGTTRLQRDADTVRRVRAGLTRVETAELAVNGFITQFENRGLDITLPRIMGRRLTRLKSQKVIRAAFTREVYENSIKEQLAASIEKLTGASWVLSDPEKLETTNHSKQTRIEAVRELYFKRYIEEWNVFLRSIQLDQPTDERDCHAFAEFLISGEPTPYRSLFEQTKHNTSLTPEKGLGLNNAAAAAQKAALTQAQKAFGKGKIAKMAMKQGAEQVGQLGERPAREVIDEEAVTNAFKEFVRFGVPGRPVGGQSPPATHLVEYEEQLLYMRNALQTVLDSSGDRETLDAVAQKARTTILRIKADQDEKWRPIFDTLLWIPLGHRYSPTKEETSPQN